MEYQYTKAQQVKLKDIGKDEKWLQDRVQEDPSILRLGDLVVIEREKQQASGGRIDFLMYNPDDSVRYEIEIMLGKLNESHIIRTIEYWDIEKTRYPSLDHRAVIVAEDITNRFFNVIRLLNKAVPIIAIQLNTFIMDNKLVLDFVKVLDISEPTDIEEQEISEVMDRKYWDQKANSKSLQLFDSIIKMVKESDFEPIITYNKNHISLGTTGNNFAWFHPRKGVHLHFTMKTGSDKMQEIVSKLEDSGIESRGMSNGKYISIMLTIKEFDENIAILKDVFVECEKYSRE